MPHCKKLDPFVTPYVDGQLDGAERAEVDAHVRVCPPCSARIAIEQSIRDLLSARKPALKKECASAALRKRCAGFAGIAGRTSRDPYATRLFTPTRLRPLALA